MAWDFEFWKAGAQLTRMHLLFVSYGGGHIAMQLPVALRARDLGYRVTILGLTTAANAVRAAGFDCIGYENLWNFAGIRAREYGEALCRNMDTNGPVSLAETIAYHGINFSELVAEVGEPQAYSRFRSQGRHAFLPINLMSRVFAELCPDIIVASNSPRSERAAVMAARKLSIPAICMVDLFALQEYKWIAQPGFADKICVLNEAVRQFFIMHGRKCDELVVTGNPAFDRIMLPATVTAGQQMKSERGWNDGKVNILWASQIEPAVHPFEDLQGDPGLPRQIEAILREIVTQRDDMRLIVRYHPSENVNFVPGANVVFSPWNEPLHDLLHAVDLVVVTASTVGLEAHIAGRRVISVDLSVFSRDAPYSSTGIATGVSSLEELRATVRDYDRQQSNGLLAEPQVATKPNANAAEAVLNVIESLTVHRVE